MAKSGPKGFFQLCFMNVLLGASGDVGAVRRTDVYIVPVFPLLRHALIADQRPAAVSAEDKAPQDIGRCTKMVMLSQVRFIGFVCLL